jgi:hypothetical protein
MDPNHSNFSGEDKIVLFWHLLFMLFFPSIYRTETFTALLCKCSFYCHQVDANYVYIFGDKIQSPMQPILTVTK